MPACFLAGFRFMPLRSTHDAYRHVVYCMYLTMVRGHLLRYQVLQFMVVKLKAYSSYIYVISHKKHKQYKQR